MKALLTILVVDDSPNDLLMTRMALTGLDPPPAVLTARDGAEALDLLYQRGESRNSVQAQPHLVLLDLKMPRVDGFEVLERIKNDPRLKPLPVIVFTSSREDGDVLRCYELGANAFVVKPVDFQAFLAAVKVIVSFWGALNEIPPSNRAGDCTNDRLAGVA
ncbi:MAG: response regulator [Verrucomicrobia bacterium]|nr:response regulator [Verrucomicrobiota bacterium]